jgi:hypothetical protein
MKSTNDIATRFREITLNGTWIANTNYKLQLENLDWEVARTKIPSLNTIEILVQHVHYYINGIKNVFKGGSLDIRDKYSFDFPPMQSPEEWAGFLNKFYQDAEEFAALVEQMPEEKLEEVFVKAEYGTYRRNIDGMIEHAYYHLGQIVLIRKLIENEK